MRSAEERISELHKRVRGIRRERNKRRFYAASACAFALCLVLIFAAAFDLSARMPKVEPAEAPASATASIFTSDSALGYVAVALLAFMLGASFTVFCVRMKKHLSEKEKDDDRKS